MSEKLIVRKLTPKAPIRDRVKAFVLQQDEAPRQVVVQTEVQRPFRFSLFRRGAAGYNDDRAVAATIAAMQDSVAENMSDYQVVRVKRNGKEHELRDWERGTKAVLNKGLQSLRDAEAKRAAQSYRAGLKEKDNAENALKQVGEYPRAGVKTKMWVDGILPHPGAEARELLKPGRSTQAMERDLFGVYSRLQDGVLDPENIIYGVGESVVNQIAKIQEGRWSSIADLVIGANPKINDAVSAIENVNKLTSRDRLRYKAHGLGFTALYQALTTREKRMRTLGWVPLWHPTRGQFWSTVLPNQSRIELQRDRHMQLTDKTIAIHAHDVLAHPTNTSLGKMYQRDVAISVARALDTVPTDTKFTHAVESQIADLMKKAGNMGGGKLSKVGLGVVKVAEILGLKEKSKKGSQPTAEEQARKVVDQTRAQIEATLRKPMSIAAYTQTMTDLGKAYLQLPGLKPVEAVRWQQAVAWGELVLGTYQMAKNIINTQRRSATS